MTERGEVGRELIGHLRVRSSSEEPLSARLRLERLLSTVHLSPAGLPPSAIVCIRQLHDPRPGTLPLRGHVSRPPPAWEQALQRALRERLSQAVRPALGAVPANAEAVFFADPSELLACLASDLSGGLAGSRWWWKHLVPGAEPWKQLVREWARRPEYVPAALELLAARGEAHAFLRRLGDSEARELLVRIASRYALPALVPALDSREAPSNTPAPWERLVPEAVHAPVGLEQRTLLGVALLLHRAPTEVRRATFAPALARWRRAEARALRGLQRPAPSHAEDGAHAPAAEHPESPNRSASTRREDRENTLAPERSVTPDVAASVPREERVSVRGEREPGRDEAPLPAPSSDSMPVRTPDAPRARAPLTFEPVPESAPTAVARNGVPVREDVSPPPPDPLRPAPTTGQETRAPLRPWNGSPIRTGLGGLFYLLNLGLFLELYGDFSTPASPGIALPVWDFVTLLGRRLLVEEHPEDPLWEVLARLAGREPGTAPGADFEPPREWRVPHSWLRPFREPEAWHWDVVPGESEGLRSLRVRHPAGFLVVEVPAEPGEAEARARRECEPYSPPALAPAPVPSPDDSVTPLERWLGWLVPYVRARLQRALGESDPIGLARLLLEHEARVHVTEAHVDVVFPLANLPLPIRFAGLDRDIGWLPAAGRHVLFHFE